MSIRVSGIRRMALAFLLGLGALAACSVLSIQPPSMFTAQADLKGGVQEWANGVMNCNCRGESTNCACIL